MSRVLGVAAAPEVLHETVSVFTSTSTTCGPELDTRKDTDKKHAEMRHNTYIDT